MRGRTTFWMAASRPKFKTRVRAALLEINAPYVLSAHHWPVSKQPRRIDAGGAEGPE
jgi:hypothetical protein